MQAVARWIWHSGSLGARLARLPLAPASAGLDLAMRARAAAYHGLLARRRLPAPSIGVGNLTVGGTGKTPIASWIAGYLARAGARPAVLLRGGKWGDEALVHQRLLPAVPVIEGPDREASAANAVRGGADILVLDDAFQRVELALNLNILLISAEAGPAAARLLPAGPGREPLSAARRAGVVVITRKDATLEQALETARRVSGAVPGPGLAIAQVAITGFEPLRGGATVPTAAVSGQAVMASSGIALPEALGGQLEQLGARVRRLDWADHHAYSPRNVATIIASARGDRVIVTEKDAVKLRAIWPAEEPAPWVARTGVRWDSGADLVTSQLDRVMAARTQYQPLLTTTHL